MDLQERALFILQVCPILHDDALNEKENAQWLLFARQNPHALIFQVLIFSGCLLQAEDLQSCVPGVWKWTRSQALMASLIN